MSDEQAVLDHNHRAALRAMLERKLARRKALNEDWEARRTIGPKNAISLSFAEAEQVLEALK